MSLLSICIPTFNREVEIVKLLKSIPPEFANLLEVVVVDDGSTDQTKRVLEKYFDIFNIRYFKQTNSGRGIALRRAISEASFEYTILMDSDDFFTTKGIEEVITVLQAQSDINCFLFGVSIHNPDGDFENIPPNDCKSNFIALRADLGLKRDFKEVVRTRILQKNLYEVSPDCRRVPTFLLWAAVAQTADCVCKSVAVAVKVYLPGGMTDRNLELKVQNPRPMLQLYSLLSETPRYNSVVYRWRSRLLATRWSIHSKSLDLRVWWKVLLYFPACMIVLCDISRLFLKKL